MDVGQMLMKPACKFILLFVDFADISFLASSYMRLSSDGCISFFLFIYSVAKHYRHMQHIQVFEEYCNYRTT